MKKPPTVEAIRIQFQEAALESVRQALVDAVASRNISRTALARKMEVPESHVAAWLDHPQNLTLRKLSDIAFALNMALTLVFEPNM